jgi:hypothetical protein
MLASGSKNAKVAARNAINSVGFYALNQGRKVIEQSLDRPTPWTVKSWYLRNKATVEHLMATVGWSDYLQNKTANAADYYLKQHWNGGGREHKAFESRLIRAGIMPGNMFAVIGEAAADLKMIDQYGNMKGSVLVAILSGVRALGGDVNQNAQGRGRRLSANKRAARNVYWAGKPGVNTPNGIWMLDEKYGKRGRLRPVLVFVKAPTYRKRMDLQPLADRASSKIAGEFDAEYTRLMRARS